MKGSEYANLIAAYILKNFGDRGLKVYREIAVGQSIIGKGRRIDVMLVDKTGGDAFAIECKYQSTQGTVDEKIPYALEDMTAVGIGGCIVYAGEGFSTGVLHLLQASETAAYCLPDPDRLDRTKHTRELDHMLAVHFQWWEILVRHREPFNLDEWKAARDEEDEPAEE